MDNFNRAGPEVDYFTVRMAWNNFFNYTAEAQTQTQTLTHPELHLLLALTFGFFKISVFGLKEVILAWRQVKLGIWPGSRSILA